MVIVKKDQHLVPVFNEYQVPLILSLHILWIQYNPYHQAEPDSLLY